jgi:hypothetical protein
VADNALCCHGMRIKLSSAPALALSGAYLQALVGLKCSWGRRCATLPSIPRLTGRGLALLVMPACPHECAVLPCFCLCAADGGPCLGGRAAAGACKGFTEVLRARGCTKPLRAPSASPQRASSGASSGGGGGGDKEEAEDTAQDEESSKEEAGAGGCGAKEEAGAGVEAKEGYKAVAAAAQAVSCRRPPPPHPLVHAHAALKLHLDRGTVVSSDADAEGRGVCTW